MNEQINFSVIIPTYQGAKKVVTLIQSLIAQDYRNFEIIIVIDGSTDNTQEQARQLLVNTGISFKIITKKNTGRGSTRNAGVEHAVGPFLAFFDDDMVLEPHCLSDFNNFHSNYPNSIAVGTQLEKLEWMNTDFQRYKAYLSRKWEGENHTKTTQYSKDNLHLTAANFSIPKNIFQRLNGFDERLSDVEDFELATRAFDFGIPIYYHPFSKAWHNDLITCQSYIRRQNQYNQAYKKLVSLRPQLVGKFEQTRISNITVFKKIIYWPFSFQFWVKWIDKEAYFIKILPQKIRYKLYDLIVWSQGKIFIKNKLS